MLRPNPGVDIRRQQVTAAVHQVATFWIVIALCLQGAFLSDANERKQGQVRLKELKRQINKWRSLKSMSDPAKRISITDEDRMLLTRGTFSSTHEYIAKQLVMKAPCNLLMWGCSIESLLLMELNQNGHTSCLEQNSARVRVFAELAPEMEVYKIRFKHKLRECTPDTATDDLATFTSLQTIHEPKPLETQMWDIITTDPITKDRSEPHTHVSMEVLCVTLTLTQSSIDIGKSVDIFAAGTQTECWEQWLSGFFGVAFKPVEIWNDSKHFVVKGSAKSTKSSISAHPIGTCKYSTSRDQKSMKEKCAFVSYYYGGEGREHWEGTGLEQNLWSFLCSFRAYVEGMCPLLMLVDPSVGVSTVRAMQQYGVTVKRIRKLPHLDPRPQKSHLSAHFTKLVSWSLVQYDKVFFMDLDAWPVTNISRVFQLPLEKDVAAVKWYDGWKFNSGVMLLKPDECVYGKLMAHYLQGNWKLGRPVANGDQGFLAQFLQFSELPPSLNVKYPNKQKVKAVNAEVVHNFLEEKKHFLQWASTNGQLKEALTLAATTNRSWCPFHLLRSLNSRV